MKRNRSAARKTLSGVQTVKENFLAISKSTPLKGGLAETTSGSFATGGIATEGDEWTDPEWTSSEDDLADQGQVDAYNNSEHKPKVNARDAKWAKKNIGNPDFNPEDDRLGHNDPDRGLGEAESDTGGHNARLYRTDTGAADDPWGIGDDDEFGGMNVVDPEEYRRDPDNYIEDPTDDEIDQDLDDAELQELIDELESLASIGITNMDDGEKEHFNDIVRQLQELDPDSAGDYDLAEEGNYDDQPGDGPHGSNDGDGISNSEGHGENAYLRNQEDYYDDALGRIHDRVEARNGQGDLHTNDGQHYDQDKIDAMDADDPWGLGEGDNPDDIEWDAEWARQDGDDERADDLEADAEWARMDADDVDESLDSSGLGGLAKMTFTTAMERHTWMMQALNQIVQGMDPEAAQQIKDVMKKAGEADVIGGIIR